MKINKFEDIIAWQKGRELVRIIYQYIQKNNFNQDFSLKDQIKRSSVSVISNIAEGFERQTNKEFKQFLFISKGSCAEVRTQLYIALDCNYISKAEFDLVYNLTIEISKMLSVLIKYLNKN